MYLRFTITEIDDDSHKPQGVFVAAYSLLDSASLNADEWKRLRELFNWFNDNLPTPPDDFYASRAIFWFKAGSKNNIERIWEIVQLLRDHGYHINLCKCSHLENIVYEDEHQVAAFPSALDGKVRVQ